MAVSTIESDAYDMLRLRGKLKYPQPFLLACKLVDEYDKRVRGPGLNHYSTMMILNS